MHILSVAIGTFSDNCGSSIRKKRANREAKPAWSEMSLESSQYRTAPPASTVDAGIRAPKCRSFSEMSEFN
jgi:hypothetical protein